MYVSCMLMIILHTHGVGLGEEGVDVREGEGGGCKREDEGEGIIL